MRRSDLESGRFRLIAVHTFGLVAGLLATAAASKASVNLLANGDFNDTSAATAGAPNSWTAYAVNIDNSGTAGTGYGAFTSYKYSGDGTATDGTSADTSAYDGTPYVAIGNYNYSDSFGEEFSGIYQIVPGAAGVVYTATVASATSNYGYPDAEFHLIYLAADGTTILRTDAENVANYPNYNGTNSALSQPYATYTVPTTASPAGTAFVKFEMSLDNGVGTIYFDDASLTTASTPEPASLGLLATSVTGMMVRRRRR